MRRAPMDTASWIEEWPLKVALPMPGEDFQMAASIVPPGGESILILAKEPPVSPQSVHLIGSKVGTVYVYGEIRYTDAFGKKRRTKYRLHFGGQHGGQQGEGCTGLPYRLSPTRHGRQRSRLTAPSASPAASCGGGVKASFYWYGVRSISFSASSKASAKLSGGITLPSFLDASTLAVVHFDFELLRFCHRVQLASDGLQVGIGNLLFLRERFDRYD